MSPIYIRKTIKSQEVVKVITEICEISGLSPSEYAYGLILDDLLKRRSEKKLSADIANERHSFRTFVGEINRVLDKYSKELSSK